MHPWDRKLYVRWHVREELCAALQQRRPKLSTGDCENILGEFSRKMFGTFLLTHISERQVKELRRHIDNGMFDHAKLRSRGRPC